MDAEKICVRGRIFEYKFAILAQVAVGGELVGQCAGGLGAGLLVGQVLRGAWRAVDLFYLRGVELAVVRGNLAVARLGNADD